MRDGVGASDRIELIEQCTYVELGRVDGHAKRVYCELLTSDNGIYRKGPIVNLLARVRETETAK
jgi:hypothetical protein